MKIRHHYLIILALTTLLFILCVLGATILYVYGYRRLSFAFILPAILAMFGQILSLLLLGKNK
ncbi:MAG: hypothetical protein IKI22_02130 [Neisseriaceae bacterium]|nr:hypothetical protein [Neisseriaceae bacterium]